MFFFENPTLKKKALEISKSLKQYFKYVISKAKNFFFNQSERQINYSRSNLNCQNRLIVLSIHQSQNY
jgi:hypothetical protein